MNPTARTRKISPGRRILSALLLSVLVLAGGLGLLAALGPPNFVIAALFSDLEEHGLFLEVEQTGYRPQRGILLKSVRVFTLRDRVTPLMTAEQVHVRMGWRRWLRDRVWSAKITFSGAALETELGLWADDLVTRQRLHVRAIRGHVRVNASAIEIHELEGRLSDLRVRVAGNIPIGGQEDEDPSEMEWVPPTMRILAEVVSRVEEFNFTPFAEVDVFLRPSSLPGERVEVAAGLLFSGSGQHRGFAITEAEVDVRYEDRQLHIPLARLQGEGDYVLQADAHLDFRAELARLRLRNTLPRYAVEHLSPIPMSELLERISVRVEGDANVDMTFGPSPFSAFGNRIRGKMNVRDAFYRDAFFPELQVELSYEDRVLDIINFRGVAGATDQQGPISGSFRIDMETQAFRLGAQTGFKPQAISSLIPLEDVQEILSEWSFTGAPPQMSVYVARGEAPESLEVDLSLRGEELVVRGTLLDELSLELTVRGRKMNLSRLLARRETRGVSGTARWDFDEKHVNFKVDSSLPVDDLAVLIEPGLADHLVPYRIRGATNLQAEGRVDLSGDHQHNLRSRVELKDVQWGWRRFDGLRFLLALEGNSLEVREIWGSVGDGGFGGHVLAEKLFTPEAYFSLSLEGRGLNLSEMIIAATDTEETTYTGRLGFGIDLTGALEDQPDRSRFDSYEGLGHLEIREGELFRIPLLLGLSRILGRVFRGFGYASQTDFTASFDVVGGRVRSDDLFLSGRMISIEGDGRVDFDRQVQANLRVQVFRGGALVEVLNVFLWPLRKLIEVRLSGTLDQPDWQLRNLP